MSEALDRIVQASVADLMRRVGPRIAAAIAEAAARQVEAELSTATEKAGSSRRPRRTRRREEITRWVADRRARRVPNFVIEMTGGLDTKKKIVARFGEGVALEKGKPLPRAVEKEHSNAKASGVASVRAKPPRIRKAGQAVSA